MSQFAFLMELARARDEHLASDRFRGHHGTALSELAIRHARLTGKDYTLA
jgi:hypothetical protein